MIVCFQDRAASASFSSQSPRSSLTASLKKKARRSFGFGELRQKLSSPLKVRACVCVCVCVCVCAERRAAPVFWGFFYLPKAWHCRITQGAASKQPMTTKENILVLHEELEGLKHQLDGLSDGLCGGTPGGESTSPHVRGRPSPHAMTLSSDELRPVAEDPSHSASSPLPLSASAASSRQPTPMRLRIDAATGVTPTRLFGDDDLASMVVERDAALSSEREAKKALVKATAEAEAEVKALREALTDQQGLAEAATAATLQVRAQCV